MMSTCTLERSWRKKLDEVRILYDFAHFLVRCTGCLCHTSMSVQQGHPKHIQTGEALPRNTDARLEPLARGKHSQRQPQLTEDRSGCAEAQERQVKRSNCHFSTRTLHNEEDAPLCATTEHSPFSHLCLPAFRCCLLLGRRFRSHWAAVRCTLLSLLSAGLAPFSAHEVLYKSPKSPIL